MILDQISISKILHFYPNDKSRNSQKPNQYLHNKVIKQQKNISISMFKKILSKFKNSITILIILNFIKNIFSFEKSLHELRNLHHLLLQLIINKHKSLA